MNKQLGILALTVGLGIAMPAIAITIPNATPHAGELDVYEVYNALYGTAFTDNFDLDVQRVVDLQTFLIPSGEDLYVEAQARYASVVSEFGYYDPVGAPATYTPLFSVNTVGNVSGNGFNAVIGAGDPFGFYLDPAGEGAVWHSEQALNWLGEDHMVAYSVAGDPNVILLAWEDLPLPSENDQGEIVASRVQQYPYDGDYNDLIVELRFRQIVPEPASILLLGMGIAGIGTARLRRSARRQRAPHIE